MNNTKKPPLGCDPAAVNVNTLRSNSAPNAADRQSSSWISPLHATLVLGAKGYEKLTAAVAAGTGPKTKIDEWHRLRYHAREFSAWVAAARREGSL